jgi:hypothetical protein
MLLAPRQGDLIAKIKADAALGRMPAGRVAGFTGKVLAGSAPDVDLSIGHALAIDRPLLRKTLSLEFTLHFDRYTINALKTLVIENDRWLRAYIYR